MDEIEKEIKETIEIGRNNVDELAKIVTAYFLEKGKGFDSISEQERKDALFLASVAYYYGHQRGLKEAREN